MADELEAVNILLESRSVTPVIELTSGHPDVQGARSLLKRHKRACHSEKRWYNVEEEITLTPNVDGYIMIPARVIALDEDSNYYIMNGKLYDPETRTNIFTEAVEDLTLIFDREWENLPIQAFDYICAMAKEEFVRPLSDQMLSQQAEKDILRTRALFNITDMRYKDVGKQSGNPLMLKWQQKMIQR